VGVNISRVLPVAFTPHTLQNVFNCLSVLTPLKVLESAQGRASPGPSDFGFGFGLSCRRTASNPITGGTHTSGAQ